MLSMGRVIKKTVAVIITAAMAISFTPAQIYAEEAEDTDERVRIEANSETGPVEEEVGDVKIDEYDPAVVVRAKEEATATVTTGSIDNHGEEGDVRGEGLWTITESGGEAHVTVNGDVSAGYVGMRIESNSGGESDVTVNGDVIVDGKDPRKGIDIWSEDSKSSSSVRINGDVNIHEDNVDVWSEGGKAKATLIVTGDVVADKGVIVGTDAGESTVKIGGDLKSEAVGVDMTTASRGKVNVVVEGTIKAKGFAAVSDDDATLSVWKIEPNKDDIIVAKEEWDDEKGKRVYTTKDEEAEAAIQYIIKVKPEDGATLTATGENGKALATVEGVSNTWQWAYEGDRVLLKVDVEDGYTLDGAFGDEGQSIALLKDASGNFYIDVPRGGGVFLSIKLTKDKKDKDKDDEKKDETPVSNNAQTVTIPTAAAVAQAAVQAAVQSISSTPAGGTANVAVAGTTIDASVVKSLLARRDVNVSLACFVNGKLCTIMIPAGADLSDIINSDGTIDIEKLAKKFGKTEVQ